MLHLELEHGKPVTTRSGCQSFTLEGMEPSESSTSASDENKRRFREALDRKQNKETARPGHLDAESAIQGTHERADHKRDFRRKTG